MIVVDTSVWIAAPHSKAVAQVLAGLIEADEVALAFQVRLELWTGVRRPDRQTFLRTYAKLPHLYPTDETWRPLSGWIETAKDAGETFTILDLLIASSAAEIGGLVWSLDKDFERMEQLGFVQRYDPPDIH